MVNVKTSIFVLFSIIIYNLSTAQNNTDITGIWLTPENRSAIQIYKTGNCYEGKIIWEKNPYDKNGNPNKDIHNPNPRLRQKLLKGLVIMKNICFDKKNNKGHGTVYNVENGKTYKINIELADKNTLEVRGYIGISLIGKTSVWKRKK